MRLGVALECELCASATTCLSSSGILTELKRLGQCASERGGLVVVEELPDLVAGAL